MQKIDELNMLLYLNNNMKLSNICNNGLLLFR